MAELMNALYIVLAILTLPATLVLANLLWQGLREARGIATVLGSPELLRSIVTTDLLTNPPSEIARFARPIEGGYVQNIRFFRQADQEAHRRGRRLLRPALVTVIAASAVLGVLGLSWPGFAFPIINVFIMFSTFVRSTQGKIDASAKARAVEYVQVLAFILSRWYTDSPRDATEWLREEPQMIVLWEVLPTVTTA